MKTVDQMLGELSNEDVERVASAMHRSWMEFRLQQGCDSRRDPRSGEELLVDWSQLSDDAKNQNRGMVKGVVATLGHLGWALTRCTVITGVEDGAAAVGAGNPRAIGGGEPNASDNG